MKKKTVAVLLTMAMTAALAAGCGNAAGTAADNGGAVAATTEKTEIQTTDADGTVYKVGIVQYVDDASLNQIEKAIEEELTSSVKAIEEITGKKVTLFRPPFGDYNDRLITVAEKLGLNTVQWSVDSLDWKDLSAEEIATRVIKKAKSGSIILMHNNGLHTLESLPLIFAATQQKGLVYRPIGELIYTDDYKILPDGTQIKTN